MSDQNTDKMLVEQIGGLIKAAEDNLAAKSKEERQAMQIEIQTVRQLAEGKAPKETVEKLNEIELRLNDILNNQVKNQPVIDKMSNYVTKQNRNSGNVHFKDALAEALESKHDDIKRLEKEKGSIKLDIKGFNTKTVGDTLLSSNLTGDQMATYVGAGILPNDLINLRDIIPVRQTPTGLAVTYREGVGEGAVARQTEGNAKAQVDSDFTEVKVVQRYIAAYQRFSKQILQDLSFLQGTAARILMRKYLKKENTLLYTDLAADLTTANSPSGGNTVEKILNMVKTQRNNGYSASFVLVDWDEWYNILTSARPSTGTEYSVPFGSGISRDGDIITIGGVRVIAASWVTSADITIIDTAYIERLEVDALSVEISTQDSDNFTKNLFTYKVECRTDLNALLTSAHLNSGTQS